MLIEATITTSTDASCTSEAFPPALPDADNHTAAASGKFDGSLSARMPGCTTFDVSRLRIRFERRADIHEAFLKLGCSMICWNILQRTQQPL